MEKDDFIRRKAAILMVQRYGVGCLDPDEFTPEQAERFVIAELQAIPAADVRPVVLCRDCQYFENDCGWCGYFDIGMNVNDFCSRGEKKEESHGN